MTGLIQAPVMNFIQLCKKYELMNIVKRAMENCLYVGKVQWRKVVSLKICDMETKMWNASKCLYPSLRIVGSAVTKLNCSSWWQYAQSNPGSVRKCRNVVKLLLDCSRLQCCLFRYKEADNPYCNICEGRYIEDAAHVLFQCPGNQTRRTELWRDICVNCPPMLLDEIKSMSVDKRVSFILSGLNNSFVPEWQSLFGPCLHFINSLYIERVHTNMLLNKDVM